MTDTIGSGPFPDTEAGQAAAALALSVEMALAFRAEVDALVSRYPSFFPTAFLEFLELSRAGTDGAGSATGDHQSLTQFQSG